MSDEYWEIVEYKCQDGKCLMIHNIPNDSKLGALSLDHRDIGEAIVEELNEQQAIIEKQKRIIKSQDAEISRQYNLCLAMSGVLREEFGVYDVFDRSKDKRVK